MKAVFLELPVFSRVRADYLNDEGFRVLQNALLDNPEAGDVIEGTGGMRKVRHADPRRGKGKRGGLRVIYFWWRAGEQFWLYTVYDKNEMADLNTKQRTVLKSMLKRELDGRKNNEAKSRWKFNAEFPQLFQFAPANFSVFFLIISAITLGLINFSYFFLSSAVSQRNKVHEVITRRRLVMLMRFMIVC